MPKTANWKVKGDGPLDPEEVAKIACALKSLAAYTALACAEDDNPEELKKIVQDGLDAIDRLFEY